MSMNEPYYVRPLIIFGKMWCIFKRGARYFIEGFQDRKKAEKKCARLNAEHRKERENG